MASATYPLVSILIRSMDRPSLGRALASAAAQTWPNVEIVVVAACGEGHRALPAEFGGRPLRLVTAPDGARLPRADAANLALGAAHGEWLNFLDDDDELSPQHLVTLLTAPRDGGERLVYSQTRVLDGAGALLGHVSHAGNHVQLWFHSRATTCATLLHRSLVDEGARFDPAFGVHEDHDFQVNCATRTEFRFVDVPTCTWFADAGESGCGFGANNDDAQRQATVVRIREKWSAAFSHWLADADAVLQSGRSYLTGGDLNAAATCFEQVLKLRPGDAAAMQLDARAHLRAGDVDRAAALIAEATRVAPADADVQEAAGLLAARRQVAPTTRTSATPPAPLVSILIRSMDRASLERALDSAAAQTWSNLEIIVVAANGSAHRPLPDRWRARPLRFVRPDPDRRLSRPEAANLCLDSARGEWLNFLDDDDELLPQHVATLMAVANPARARVLHSRAEVRDGAGRPTGHVGFASFPVQLYFQNRSHPAATLFHRSLVSEGASFDAAFDVYEDHDFFINCATRSEFQFVDAATCVWNAYSGESGCGYGENDDNAQREAYLPRLQAKWASFFTPLLREPEALLFVGQNCLRVGDITVALDCLERALAARPRDVNALNLCAMANLRSGNFDRAEHLLVAALALVPGHAGLQGNLALLARKRTDSAASGE
ncbi:MAG: glycosyltransferase [Rudaea sp.]